MVEQGAGLGAVIHLAAGLRRRYDPVRVGVHAEVEMLWGEWRVAGSARHATIAWSLNHTVKLPRWRRPAS